MCVRACVCVCMSSEYSSSHNACVIKFCSGDSSFAAVPLETEPTQWPCSVSTLRLEGLGFNTQLSLLYSECQAEMHLVPFLESFGVRPCGRLASCLGGVLEHQAASRYRIRRFRKRFTYFFLNSSKMAMAVAIGAPFLVLGRTRLGSLSIPLWKGFYMEPKNRFYLEPKCVLQRVFPMETAKAPF